MNLTVHIGTTKTGSTSIQAFLRTNRAAFAERGICIPASLGVQDHRRAAISALEAGQARDLMQRQGIKGEAALAEFRDKTRAAFRRELRRGVQEVVITSEHLQSRCNRPENVARFAELFAEGFDRLRIVVYVRPQLDQLISLYSTTLRNGFSETMAEHVERHMTEQKFTYFDLQGIVIRWADVFGMENIDVRPYRALPPPTEGGVVADFCALLGQRHDDPAFTRPAEVNSSINAAGQELLRIVNGNGGIDQERRQQVIAWVEANCSGKGAVPTRAQAHAFQDRFREGNAWVAERFFPAHPDYLEPRYPADQASV